MNEQPHYRTPALSGEIVRTSGPAADCFVCAERAYPPLVEIHGSTGKIATHFPCGERLGVGLIQDAGRGREVARQLRPEAQRPEVALRVVRRR